MGQFIQPRVRNSIYSTTCTKLIQIKVNAAYVTYKFRVRLLSRFYTGDGQTSVVAFKVQNVQAKGTKTLVIGEKVVELDIGTKTIFKTNDF